MSNRDRWSQILNALSDPYRRQLLVTLLDHNPQDDTDPDLLEVVAERGEDTETLQTEIVHAHLPKLEEMGVIEWDREANRIRKGSNRDDIVPILKLIEDHKDELPDGQL